MDLKILGTERAFFNQAVGEKMAMNLNLKK